MARHARRLINWIGGIALALALLVVLALLYLLWFVDPNSWRARIAHAATQALGREVQLGGDLHWSIGRNIAIASEGGSIVNAPGFDATPFAQWQRLSFGLNARALLGRRMVIDQLAIDGLQVNLQRNATGAGNWNFMQANTEAGNTGAASSKPIALQVASIQLRRSRVSFRDAQGAWLLGDVALDVKLPPDFTATTLELRDVVMHGRLSGGPLPASGVAVAFEAASARQDKNAATLDVPAFQASWNDARLAGSVKAGYGAAPAAQGKFRLRVPSVRTQLQRLEVALPPMADSKTLGKLDADGLFDIKGSTLGVTGLHVVLDDTQLDGTVSMPQFTPLSLRFDLVGDSMDFDRYLEPADYKGKPFELPLAQLKALNVQGVLKMKSATVMGAKATELRIDVE